MAGYAEFDGLHFGALVGGAPATLVGSLSVEAGLVTIDSDLAAGTDKILSFPGEELYEAVSDALNSTSTAIRWRVTDTSYVELDEAANVYRLVKVGVGAGAQAYSNDHLEGLGIALEMLGF